MGWTIFALVMTVLMGGIIAYNGDLIGRKFGKRRLSLFGLRPKHTAILITSLTGVFISAITTGVIFLLVPPVNRVILQGEQALRDNLRYKRMNASLLLARQDAEARLAQKQADLAQTQKELLSSQQQLLSKQAEIKQAQQRLYRIQQALAHAQADIRAARAETRQLTTRNAILNRMNRELAEGNLQLAEQNKNLTETNRALKQENTGLLERNLRLTKQNQEAEQQNKEIADQNLKLIRENGNLLKVNKSLRDENYELAARNEELEKRNQRLVAVSRALYGTEEAFKMVRTRRVVIHGGEELARTIIPAGTSREEVRKTILNLMEEANRVALAKGAGTGNKTRAVQVVDKQFYTLSDTGELVPFNVTETVRIEAMVDRLSYTSRPVCVLALAVANSVEDEPASIDFQPFTNALIYHKGQLVDSRILDASRPPEQVFSELVDFLKSMGRSALERGMIPRFDPSTGEPLIGSLGAADLVKLVERVRATGKNVQIAAQASEDIYAAGPLELEFHIERVR